MSAVRSAAVCTRRTSIDSEAAENDGFFIATMAPNIDTTTVDVEVITERADATECFRARYGPHVRAKVIATELYHLACTALYDHRTGPDPARLTIGWEAAAPGSTTSRWPSPATGSCSASSSKPRTARAPPSCAARRPR